MRKNKFNNVAGLTLIEIMLGVVISSIMMAAMYTTYNVVNNSYSQVVDRAKISRSGRDIVGMIMRDIRLAGFKYYYGVHKENEDRRENNQPYIPREDYLKYQGLTSSIYDSHDPIIIIKDQLGNKPQHGLDATAVIAGDVNDDETKHQNIGYVDYCCDKIHIVYGDFNEDHINEIHDPPRTFNQPYKRYRITYYAMPRSSKDGKYYGIYKDNETWAQAVGEQDGFWVSDTGFCPECFSRELIRDHLVDMEFIAFNQHGRIIDPPPRPDAPSRKDLYNIRSVDVRLTFRSKKPFYRFDKLDAEGNIIPRLVKGLGERTTAIEDKYLRDSVVVTIHTRNIGQ